MSIRRNSRSSLPGLVGRHATAGMAASIAVAVMVLALAALACAVPRAVSVLFTDTARSAVAALPPLQRDVIASGRSGPATGSSQSGSALPGPLDAVWGRHEDALAAVRDEMPAALRQNVGTAQYVVTLDPAPARPLDTTESSPDTELGLAFDPHFADRIVLTNGRAPAPATSGLPGTAPVEVLLSDASAQRMQLAVGGERSLAFADGSSQTVKLVGTFTAKNPHDDYWSLIEGSLAPTVLSSGLEPLVTGLAFADAASWANAGGLAASATTAIWFPVLSNHLTSADLQPFADGLLAFTRIPHRIGPITDYSSGPAYAPPLGSVSFGSDLGRTLNDVFVRTAATEAVLAMTASGPIGVALATLLLGSRLVVRRRAPGLHLAAARGATVGQLRVVLAVEGALIGLPAAAVGALVGALLVPGATGPGTVVLPVLVGLVPVVLLAWGAPAAGARRQRSDLRMMRYSWVVDVLIVGLALVSVVLLGQRGLTTATADVGVDPLLAAAPLLLSLAGCVVVMRLYPVPLRWVAKRMKSGDGLTGFLGSVRALRDPVGGFAPVLALVVGVSVAVFSVGVLATVRAGVNTAAVAAIGADMRVGAPYLSTEQLSAVRALPGVEAIAPVYSEIDSTVTIDGGREPVSVIAVSAAELTAVQRSVPGAPTLPTSLRTARDQHVPVVFSAALAAALKTGSRVELAGHSLNVVGTAPSVSPLTSRSTWMIVDQVNAQALTGYAPAPERVLIDLTPRADVDVVSHDIRSLLGPDVEIDTPHGAAAVAAADPAVQGLQSALLLALLVAWLLTAAAVALTLVLGSPGRRSTLALLRALGVQQGKARGLLAWEIAPMALTALVIGSLLGCALPLIVLAGVDLRPFTHGQTQPALIVDPGLLALVLGGFAMVVAAGAAAALAFSRRTYPAGALRIIEEG